MRRVTIIVFKILYLVALFIEVAVRAPSQKTWKAATKTDRRVSRTEVILLGSLWIPMIILPLIYLEGHTLVTNGIYSYIRHPMYVSQWLWGMAQILLLQNWLVGPTKLIYFIPVYILRVPAEEKMMLDTFGDHYRQYMKKTGGVIPKF